VRESRTPGSARGGRGNPVPYRYRPKAGWRGHASGFRRRSPLAMFFWICRMLKSVERGERFDLVDDARSRLSSRYSHSDVTEPGE
jgi:hypothetical protein